MGEWHRASALLIRGDDGQPFLSMAGTPIVRPGTTARVANSAWGLWIASAMPVSKGAELVTGQLRMVSTTAVCGGVMSTMTRPRTTVSGAASRGLMWS